MSSKIKQNEIMNAQCRDYKIKAHYNNNIAFLFFQNLLDIQ